ncbi:MAG: PilZ domain-containing protein [SAR324 cluster bacterium]|nr:PilZ domain-containing protein [SAR324 cluster bacterium]
MKKPRQTRYDYNLAAELNVRGETINGQIIDWAEGGIQVLSVLPIEEHSAYRARFFLERNRFEGDQFKEETWELEGSIAWQRPYKDGSWIGINFDTPLKIPFQQINDYFSAEDFCHIAIYTASEELQLSNRTPEQTDFTEEDMLPYHWFYWAMWCVVVALEIGILIVLARGK